MLESDSPLILTISDCGFLLRPLCCCEQRGLCCSPHSHSLFPILIFGLSRRCQIAKSWAFVGAAVVADWKYTPSEEPCIVNSQPTCLPHRLSSSTCAYQSRKFQLSRGGQILGLRELTRSHFIFLMEQASQARKSKLLLTLRRRTSVLPIPTKENHPHLDVILQ